MAYATIDNPELFFQTKLYSGTGSALSITLDGSENMQPDWVWIKERNASASSHNLTDSVRGAGKGLFSNDTSQEYDYGTGSSGSVRSFDSDGFTLGTASQVNPSGVNMVSWNWKAGTSVSGTTGGSGTSKSYSGSVSTTSGFSIIAYVGNGTAGHTIPHHLGAVPRVLIVKGRDQTENWTVYHEGLTSNNYALRLNSNAAEFSQTLSWNDTTPTSSVFTLGGGAGTSDYTNRDGINMIAYCFAEKKGYSRFGSYRGNGDANGTFIYTGFKPAWVLVKRADGTDHWTLWDNKRNAFNVDDNVLYPSLNSAESTSDTSYACDFLSNGIKWRGTSTGMNASGADYVYFAFAESPFVNSNSVPNNAR